MATGNETEGLGTGGGRCRRRLGDGPAGMASLHGETTPSTDGAAGSGGACTFQLDRGCSPGPPRHLAETAEWSAFRVLLLAWSLARSSISWRPIAGRQRPTCNQSPLDSAALGASAACQTIRFPRQRPVLLIVRTLVSSALHPHHVPSRPRSLIHARLCRLPAHRIAAATLGALRRLDARAVFPHHPQRRTITPNPPPAHSARARLGWTRLWWRALPPSWLPLTAPAPPRRRPRRW